MFIFTNFKQKMFFCWKQTRDCWVQWIFVALEPSKSSDLRLKDWKKSEWKFIGSTTSGPKPYKKWVKVNVGMFKIHQNTTVSCIIMIHHYFPASTTKLFRLQTFKEESVSSMRDSFDLFVFQLFDPRKQSLWFLHVFAFHSMASFFLSCVVLLKDSVWYDVICVWLFD